MGGGLSSALKGRNEANLEGAELDELAETEEAEYPNLKALMQRLMALEEVTSFDEDENDDARQARLERERKFLEDIDLDFFGLPNVYDLDYESQNEPSLIMPRSENDDFDDLPPSHRITKDEYDAEDGVKLIAKKYYGNEQCAQAIVKYNASSDQGGLRRDVRFKDDIEYVIGNFTVGQVVLLPTREYAKESIGKPDYYKYAISKNIFNNKIRQQRART